MKLAWPTACTDDPEQEQLMSTVPDISGKVTVSVPVEQAFRVYP